jgi:UDP-N-acetylmuramoyl-L-alanyl-D-glutamate--2,6-diaminopimelate ligase
MLLSNLLADLNLKLVSGTQDLEIKAVSPDSRKIEKGSLFVAIKGLTVDSHDFIPQVIENGAVAIIGEQDPKSEWLEKVTYIKVDNAREALGIIAGTWFDNPSHKLKVIGVTGTEGKTTTCNLIYHILKECQKKVGLISTINAKISGHDIDTGLHVTSPEALPLQELLSKMVEAECQYAIVETTSMGLHQGRVAGVKYDVAVLTNITQDHLDYHGTIENYREAKAMLFRRAKVSILNKDDSSWAYMITEAEEYSDYGLNEYLPYEKPGFFAEHIEFKPEGTTFDLLENAEKVQIKTKLLGNYNVSNTLAAIAAVREIESTINLNDIAEALESFETPEGRLERIEEGQNFTVFVDFAHTPGALENVLSTLAQAKPEGKKLIALYGAAGERDATKRPAMGKASRHADITIFTLDDPRSEKVEDITAEMEKGALEVEVVEAIDTDSLNNSNGAHLYYKESDREKAIRLALSLAQDGDIVALCGKGHEKSLAIGKEEIPWSDQEVARKILKDLRSKI